jgi:NTE family protein
MTRSMRASAEPFTEDESSVSISCHTLGVPPTSVVLHGALVGSRMVHSGGSGQGSDPGMAVSLCLSGGGYRAALFHLGALRRLNELGILGKVNQISSVSGGSIVAAHLANVVPQWPRPGSRIPQWDIQVADPFKELVTRNIRTSPMFKRALPWNWLRTGTQVEALANRYERCLTNLRMVDLPLIPEYVFCATDISYGVNWEFRREQIGDYRFGHSVTPETLTVAAAVAASSCFPPLFSPMRLSIDPNKYTGGLAAEDPNREKIGKRLGLSDGGLYDNLALEPVWKNANTILVSDGGATFTSQADRGIAWRLSRYASILGSQAGAMRRRWFVAKLRSKEIRGAYWGIASSHGDGMSGGYPAALVDNRISRIRTDLDAFSDAEICVLENHGYRKASLAARRYLAHLTVEDSDPSVAPNPEWLGVDRADVHLRNSHKRELPFGRFSSDWECRDRS